MRGWMLAREETQRVLAKHNGGQERSNHTMAAERAGNGKEPAPAEYVGSSSSPCRHSNPANNASSGGPSVPTAPDCPTPVSASTTSGSSSSRTSTVPKAPGDRLSDDVDTLASPCWWCPRVPCRVGVAAPRADPSRAKVGPPAEEALGVPLLVPDAPSHAVLSWRPGEGLADPGPGWVPPRSRGLAPTAAVASAGLCVEPIAAGSADEEDEETWRSGGTDPWYALGVSPLWLAVRRSAGSTARPAQEVQHAPAGGPIDKVF